ncbi:MAG: hypothetical protein H0T79_12870 [Deltaproteobacteria bacterium]|nr:hypothetical protein [Deltaproteobacteria bacterium]
MIEEITDEDGVDLGGREVGGSTAKSFYGEANEQAEGGAIGFDLVRACLALPQEPVREEGLEQRWKVGGHHRSPLSEVARSVASWSRSGTRAGARRPIARDTTTKL